MSETRQTSNSTVVKNAPAVPAETANADTNSNGDMFSQPHICKVLDSDIAVNILLTRMKQSLSTCEELVKFIRKKYLIETDHAQELSKTFKKFFLNTSGPLSQTIQSVAEYDGKMAEVKFSYVKALQTMYDELSALLLTMADQRKTTKEHSRKLEKEVIDAISSAEKAKSRYTSLCQDMEKLKMTDPTKTKLTLRGSKTKSEQEEELVRKVDSADLEYKQRVDHATSLRTNFVTRERPQIVQRLKDMILELDIAISIQLQKYTVWTENVILNSGVVVAPFDGTSMKSIAGSMQNEQALYSFLEKYTGKQLVNQSLIPVDYKKHPSMQPKGVPQPRPLANKIPSRVVSTSHESPFIGSKASTNTSFMAPVPGVAPNSRQPNSSGNMVIPKSTSPTRSMLDPLPNRDIGSASKHYPSLDPGHHRLPSVSSTLISEAQASNIEPDAASLPPGITKNQKTFGVPLEDILDYEHDMVPSIVRQCIHVVDKYGLDLEGIYRKSANVLDISKLREEIDHDPENLSRLIPQDPKLDSDIYMVGSLLKLFFSSLPDTLLPASLSEEVKTCLSIDDYTTRKNFMHGILYKLPDGQYWTLRSLVFHLKRVLAHEESNRMNIKSLCIIWGPTVIPGDSQATEDPSANMEDINYKIKAMEVLIDVAEQAFEPE